MEIVPAAAAAVAVVVAVGVVVPSTYIYFVPLFFPEPWTDREVMYIAYIGNLFLRMLKALILPLIIPSLVAAVGSLDMSLSGKVRTCLVFL